MKLWTAILLVEKMPTNDGRYVERVELPDDPLVLQALLNDNGGYGHDGAVRAGTIHAVRREAPYIVGDLRLQDDMQQLEERIIESVYGNGSPVPIGADLQIGTAISDEDGLWILDARMLGATVLLFNEAAFPQARVVCERVG